MVNWNRITYAKQKAIKDLLDANLLKVDKEGVIWTNRYVGGRIGNWRKKCLRIGRHGYYETTFKHQGKSFRVLAHHIISVALWGIYNKQYEVNHKDGNKLNNHPANLELVTRSQNATHAYSIGLLIPQNMRGENNPNRKLNMKDVVLIRHQIRSGLAKRKELARDYHVSLSTIDKIASGEIWKY